VKTGRRFRLEIDELDVPDWLAEVRLRFVLKRLLRVYSFRCVEIAELPGVPGAPPRPLDPDPPDTAE
jgi:hypothetical protein